MRLDALVSGTAAVVGPETSLVSAARFMVDQDAAALAVVGGRELIGILTDRDLVRAASEGVPMDEVPVSDWMSEAPDTMPPNVSIAEAAEWMLEMGYRHLPVVDEDELLGIVDVRDLLWAVIKAPS
jgi:CBS domain-containing protein